MSIWTFLKALPALIELVKTLEARIEEAELERKVSDDIKTINEAFNAKDPAKLNALFNS